MNPPAPAPTVLQPPRPTKSVRWTEPPDGVRPACLGDPELWESTDPELISWAVAACQSCPARGWCQDETSRLRSALMDLQGVWAGQVYPVSGGE